MYLVDADRPVLLDSGMTFMYPELQKQIDAVLGERPLWGVIHTHSHFDHLGCTAQLVARYPGLEAIGHKRVADLLAKDKAVQLMAALNDGIGSAVGSVCRFGSFAITRTVDERDVIDIGGIVIQVLATPGHTRDSLSYWIDADEVVVVGEAAGVPTPTGGVHVEFLTSVDDYLAGIEKIRLLAPRVLGLPHMNYVEGHSDVADYLARSSADTRTYVKRLAQYWQELGNAEAVFERVFQEDYAGGKSGQPEPAYRLNLEAQVGLIGGMWAEILPEPAK